MRCTLYLSGLEYIQVAEYRVNNSRLQGSIKGEGISWSAELLLACQEVLCSMVLFAISYFLR
jgi:hypothetical protein